MASATSFAIAGELVRGGGAEGGVERHIAGLAVHFAGTDIAAALALGAGARAFAGGLARHFVDGGLEFAGRKLRRRC